MSLPYFPLYPDDFEADTAHLTMAEDGAYNRLLRLCWRSPGCTIPADQEWIHRRMRALSDADKAIINGILSEFFQLESGRYFNPRLSREWKQTNAAHEKRKSAGSKGGKAKALKTSNKASSNALALTKQPEPKPEPEPEPDSLAVARAKPAWTREEVCTEGWTPAQAGFDYANDRGIEDATEQVRKFQEFHRNPSIRPARCYWRAWVNWIDREADSRAGVVAFSTSRRPMADRTAIADAERRVITLAAATARASGADHF